MTYVIVIQKQFDNKCVDSNNEIENTLIKNCNDVFVSYLRIPRYDETDKDKIERETFLCSSIFPLIFHAHYVCIGFSGNNNE